MVELQRIQTRLQQLGRTYPSGQPQQSISPGYRRSSGDDSRQVDSQVTSTQNRCAPNPSINELGGGYSSIDVLDQLVEHQEASFSTHETGGSHGCAVLPQTRHRSDAPIPSSTPRYSSLLEAAEALESTFPGSDRGRPFPESHDSTEDNPVTRPSPQTQLRDPLMEAMQQLDAQAHRVNSIALDLKNALTDMGAIAHRLDYQRAQAAIRGHRSAITDLGYPLVCDNQAIAIPQVERTGEGRLMVTQVPLGRLSDQGEADSLAHSLRRKSPRKPSSHQAGWAALLQWLMGGIGPQSEAKPKSQPVSHPRYALNQPTIFQNHTTLQGHVAPVNGTQFQSASPTDSAGDAGSSMTLMGSLFWFGGFMLVRVALDALLAAYPVLWPPAIALVVTPAAIAIYRTTVDPQSSFLLGRRLLLIMIGLLLGGRI